MFGFCIVAVLVGAYLSFSSSDDKPMQDGLDVIETSDGKIYVGDMNAMQTHPPSSDTS